jgi:hypothetical protein
MVGDFRPDHEMVGLHNDDFRPFASPMPFLAIRPMVPADLPFFIKQEPTPLARLTQLKVYRRVFAGRLGERWANALDSAELKLRRNASDTLNGLGVLTW